MSPTKNKKTEGFSAEEKAAMRARARELKAAAEGEEAELVTTEKIGRVRRCMLAPYAFEGISTWLQRLDRFAQVVERTKGAR